MAESIVLYEVSDEGVATLVLNDPTRRNVLSVAMLAELTACFELARADPAVRCVVLASSHPRVFSAGADLGEFGGDAALVRKHDAAGGFVKLFRLIGELGKPSIVKANGHVLAGALGIALACDLIVASEAAIFALPEPRVGLAALAGGLHRQPRTIGVKRAMGMILSGRRVPAREGEALGFVNEVAAPGDLMAAARRWAGLICECGPMSIRASKAAVMRGLDEPSLEAAIKGQNRYEAVAALYASEDFVEGPLAFAQKRPPRWKGR